MRTYRKRLHRLWLRFGRGRRGVDDSSLRGNNRLDERRRRARGLVRVANQFEQMVIFNVLDLIRQSNEAAVDIVESAAVELVAGGAVAEMDLAVSGA